MRAASSARQRAIIEAALACFSRHGVEATTIDMIREASGASVGSLYHRFGNKEGIAAEVYVEGLREFRQWLEKGLEDVGTLDEAVRTIVRTNVDWIVANPDWARFIFNHRIVLTQANREAAFAEEMRESNQRWQAKLEGLTGIEQLTPAVREVLTSLVAGPVHDYARQWLDGRRPTPLQDLREVFADAASASLHLS